MRSGSTLSPSSPHSPDRWDSRRPRTAGLPRNRVSKGFNPPPSPFAERGLDPRVRPQSAAGAHPKQHDITKSGHPLRRPTTAHPHGQANGECLGAPPHSQNPADPYGHQDLPPRYRYISFPGCEHMVCSGQRPGLRRPRPWLQCVLTHRCDAAMTAHGLLSLVTIKALHALPAIGRCDSSCVLCCMDKWGSLCCHALFRSGLFRTQ